MSDTHVPVSDETNGNEAQSAAVTRRRLLGSMAGAGVGASGVGLGAESASATDFTGCDDWLEAPAAVPEVDLTDEEPTTSNLEPIEDADEIVVYVHGWLGLESSTDQATVVVAVAHSPGHGHPTQSRYELDLTRSSDGWTLAGHRDQP